MDSGLKWINWESIWTKLIKIKIRTNIPFLFSLQSLDYVILINLTPNSNLIKIKLFIDLSNLAIYFKLILQLQFLLILSKLNQFKLHQKVFVVGGSDHWTNVKKRCSKTQLVSYPVINYSNLFKSIVELKKLYY
jgi:hypothetical protein